MRCSTGYNFIINRGSHDQGGDEEGLGRLTRKGGRLLGFKAGPGWNGGKDLVGEGDYIGKHKISVFIPALLLGFVLAACEGGDGGIQDMTPAVNFVLKIGGRTVDGELQYPEGVAVDGSGNVYVADTNNHRIQKFSSDGVFITKWGTYGSGDGQFSHPRSVAVDGLGNVYVADYGNHRIQKFSQ